MDPFLVGFVVLVMVFLTWAAIRALVRNASNESHAYQQPPQPWPPAPAQQEPSGYDFKCECSRCKAPISPTQSSTLCKKCSGQIPCGPTAEDEVRRTTVNEISSGIHPRFQDSFERRRQRDSDDDSFSDMVTGAAVGGMLGGTEGALLGGTIGGVGGGIIGGEIASLDQQENTPDAPSDDSCCQDNSSSNDCGCGDSSGSDN